MPFKKSFFLKDKSPKKHLKKQQNLNQIYFHNTRKSHNHYVIFMFRFM